LDIATAGRRAAGTRTFLDVLRAWALLPQSTPEKDLAALSRGDALIVAARLHCDDGWHRGSLRIAMTSDTPLSWIERQSSNSVTFGLPVRLRDVRLAFTWEHRHVGKALQSRVLVFNASGHLWQMAVPTIDVPLVREAFRSAGPPGA